MNKKNKLIMVGSVVLGGSIITGIAVSLSQKTNELTPEQKQEQEKITALTKEYKTTLSEANDKLGERNPELSAIQSALPNNPTSDDLQNAINKINELINTKKQQDDDSKKTKEDNGSTNSPNRNSEQQQEGAKTGSDEKTEKNNGSVSSQNSNNEKQQEGTETKSRIVQTAKKDNGQVNSQNDNSKTREEEGTKTVSRVIKTTEENSITAKSMKSQVDSQSKATKDQQNHTKVNKTVENSIESIKEKVADLKSTLIPIKFYFSGGYFYLKLQTSQTIYDKIKNNRLEFELKHVKDGIINVINDRAAEFDDHKGHNLTYLYYSKEGGDNVSFVISSELSYGSNTFEKGDYEVVSV